MRVVIISNINNKSNVVIKTGNQLFEHCGNIDRTITEETYKSYGYETVIYNKNISISKDDIILFSDRSNFYKGWKFLYRKGLLKNTICTLIESEVVDKKCGKEYLYILKDAFPKILTYQDDIIDHISFYKYWPSINCSSVMKKSETEYRERGLAAIICTNQLCNQLPGELYSERKKIIDYFESNSQYVFGVFGRNWNGYRNWGGVCHSKLDIYHKYRFAICLENSRVNGYITEKIFDCFQYGIVPVYGGAPNITDYIPADCFIDYFSFNSLDEMVHYLEKMSEEDYNGYISAIEDFLRSEGLNTFSVESQIQRVCNIIPKLPSEKRISIETYFSMFFKFGIPDFWRHLHMNALYIKEKIPLVKNIKIKFNH